MKQYVKRLTDNDMISAAYLCNVEAEVINVISIKILPKFDFESQNVTVIGTSPVAHVSMRNVMETEGKYETLLNSVIYVLDHSLLYKTDKINIFNIIGIIDEPKPTFGKIDLILFINIENGGDKIEESVNCKIIDIKDSYYTLSCEGKSNILYDLQSAISFIGNDSLVINFDENSNTEIIFDYSNSNNNKKIITKKSDSKNLSTGVIAAIIIAPSVILIAITIIVLSRKGRDKSKKN